YPFGLFLLPTGLPFRFTSVIQRGGLPRRLPRPRARRSNTMMPSSICCRSSRRSASILLMSISEVYQWPVTNDCYDGGWTLSMIGEILDAKYRIDKQLGAGGMGNVYLATHLGTTRVVAVKVIAPRWAADPHFLARFQREAQACGPLRHVNIVNVTDFGICSERRVQIPYLVMELLDGETLSAF